MAGFSNDHFQERDRWDTQIDENSARIAWAWGTVKSKGWGEFYIPDPIMFGVTFIYEPTVAYGFALDDDEQLEYEPEIITAMAGQAGPSNQSRFPRAGGGVARWVRDGRDFYVGAYVFLTVATADPIQTADLAAQDYEAFVDEYSRDPGYDLTHSFTFNSLGMKEFQ